MNQYTSSRTPVAGTEIVAPCSGEGPLRVTDAPSAGATPASRSIAHATIKAVIPRRARAKLLVGGILAVIGAVSSGLHAARYARAYGESSRGSGPRSVEPAGDGTARERALMTIR